MTRVISISLNKGLEAKLINRGINTDGMILDYVKNLIKTDLEKQVEVVNIPTPEDVKQIEAPKTEETKSIDDKCLICGKTYDLVKVGEMTVCNLCKYNSEHADSPI